MSGIEADNHDQRPTKIVKTDNTDDPQQQMDILSPRLKLDNHLLISFSNSNLGDGRHAQIANVAKTNRLVVKPNVQVQIGYQRSNQRKAIPTNNYNLLISGDHTIAERWRRQKLMQKFIALSALIPGLKKVCTLFFFPFFFGDINVFISSRGQISFDIQKFMPWKCIHQMLINDTV